MRFWGEIPSSARHGGAVQTAFLYPGQGSQRVGMGAQLLAEEPALFERYVGAADRVTGLPISRCCLEGPLEELTRTEVAQPALFSLSLALTDYARHLGLEPSWVAGHSLGEYTAAVAAGALTFSDGLRLVADRGRAMAEIQSIRPGGMIAIAGLDADAVQRLCEGSGGRVVVANVNSPIQVVVSGEVEALDGIASAARAAGAEEAVRLNVGAAFHSPGMASVQERIDTLARELEWKDPRVPVVSVLDGGLLERRLDVRSSLVRQITGTVNWLAVVRALLRAGATSFLELGSGRVLTGLARQTDPDIDAFAADSPARVRLFHERSVARQATSERGGGGSE